MAGAKCCDHSPCTGREREEKNSPNPTVRARRLGGESLCDDARSASAIFLLMAMLSMFFASVAFGASANNIRIGYPQPSGAMLPIWVMAETKLDQKYGVDLQNIYISGGARLTQTLVSGDIELAATGGAVINAVLSGADVTYVAASVPTYGFSLYVRN